MAHYKWRFAGPPGSLRCFVWAEWVKSSLQCRWSKWSLDRYIGTWSRTAMGEQKQTRERYRDLNFVQLLQIHINFDKCWECFSKVLLKRKWSLNRIRIPEFLRSTATGAWHKSRATGADKHYSLQIRVRWVFIPHARFHCLFPSSSIQ